MTTEAEIQAVITDALYEHMEEGGSKVSEVTTFQDAGVMTYNAGLVIETEDGDEFQVQIVRSR